LPDGEPGRRVVLGDHLPESVVLSPKGAQFPAEVGQFLVVLLGDFGSALAEEERVGGCLALGELVFLGPTLDGN
jgi:hypothetical protein